MEEKKQKLYSVLDRSLMVIVGILVLVFVLFPFVMVFKEGLFDGENQLNIVEFQSYFDKNIGLLKNSLFVAVITTFFSTSVAVFIAIYHFLAKSKMKRIITLTLMLTMISPPFVTSLAYINLFGRRGLISHELLQLTYNPYGAHGIILMQTIGFISLNSLLLIGVLKGIDKSIIESAISLGAKTTHIVKDMLLPLMKQGIVVVILLSFIRSLADFSTPSIIGGAYKVLATEGYLSVIAQGDIKQAAVINIIIFIPAIAVFVIYMKSYQDITSRHHGSVQSTIELKKQGILYWVSKIVALFFLLCLFLQYSSIFFTAITAKKMGVVSFTLSNIIESKQYISNTFIRSIVYSLIAGFFGSCLSLILVYYSQIRNIRWMKWIDFIATMPYIMPGTFFGLGYIFAFSQQPFKLTGTATIVVLNVLFKQLAFSTKVSSAALSQINPELLQSVRDLGGSRIHELKDVIFPLAKEGLYVSFINGFTSTMTTIGSIIFLVYPGQKVATLVLFDVVQSGKYRIASVIACYIIMICLIANGLYYLLINRKGRKGKYVFES